MNIRAIARLGAAAIVNALYFASGYLFADPVSKDEAVAMVQKAVAAIKSGPRRPMPRSAIRWASSSTVTSTS